MGTLYQPEKNATILLRRNSDSQSQAMGTLYQPEKNAAVFLRRNSDSLKKFNNVRFSNDIVFQDYVREGELERIGCFMRSRRVSLDTIYHSGMGAIHEAVLSGNLECVKLLLKFEADIHQRDEAGWTPLHMACSDGFPDIAQCFDYLKTDKASRQFWGGRTPVWEALHQKMHTHCGYLLSMGADRDLENEQGEKPGDLIDPGNKKLLAMFAKAN